MGNKDYAVRLRLPEISAEELEGYTDYEDFLRRYGNPVIIRSKGQRDMICMLREYYERLVLDMEYCRESIRAGHWIYEFTVTEEKRQELAKCAAQRGMTMDELLVSSIERTFQQIEFDPETEPPINKRIDATAEKIGGICLTRYYPVYGEECQNENGADHISDGGEVLSGAE